MNSLSEVLLQEARQKLEKVEAENKRLRAMVAVARGFLAELDQPIPWDDYTIPDTRATIDKLNRLEAGVDNE